MLMLDSMPLFAYPYICRNCPPLCRWKSLTRSCLILAEASFIGVFPSLRRPSSAEDLGGRAGDMSTGGDIPGGSPSNESSSSDSLTGVVGLWRDDLPARRLGVSTDGSRISTTPFQSCGSVPSGRYGFDFFGIVGVLSVPLGFSGETIFDWKPDNEVSLAEYRL